MLKDGYEANDIMHIKDLRILAKHGMYKAEAEREQEFRVCLDLYGDLRGALLDGNKLIDYSKISHYVYQYFTNRDFTIIETAVEGICEEIIEMFDAVHRVTIEIKKMDPTIGIDVAYVSVKATRRRKDYELLFTDESTE